MIAKTFEVRDAGAFIPILAVQLCPGNEQDRYLIARAGYGRLPANQAAFVMLCLIDGGTGECTSDSYGWKGVARTMPEAHRYIEDNFEALESGEVIDVQYILQETPTKKVSEANYTYQDEVGEAS